MISIFVLLFSIFILFLVLPIEVQMHYSNKKFSAYICFLFFKLNISNLKQKKIKDKKNTNQKSKIKVSKYFNIFCKLCKSSFMILMLTKIILKKIKFKKFHVILFISSNEAKQCATNYFYIRTAIYYASEILKLKNKINKFRVKIIPLFIEEGTNIKFNINFNASILVILSSIFEFIFCYFHSKNHNN